MPASSTTPVAVEKAYDLLLWLLPKTEKFPRSYRQTLGHRIVDSALELQGIL